jgi:hypothetical protein
MPTYTSLLSFVIFSTGLTACLVRWFQAHLLTYSSFAAAAAVPLKTRFRMQIGLRRYLVPSDVGRQRRRLHISLLAAAAAAAAAAKAPIFFTVQPLPLNGSHVKKKKKEVMDEIEQFQLSTLAFKVNFTLSVR